MPASRDLGPCPLCGRAMIAGPSIDRHHWVPKSRGGRDMGALHTVCHRMIHRVFSEKELATVYARPEAVRCPAPGSGAPGDVLGVRSGSETGAAALA